MAEIVNSLFGVTKKKIGYMRNCKDNVEKLMNEVKMLKFMKRRVQRLIGIAEVKGDNLLPGVEEWLNKASDEISEAEVFLGEFLDAKKTCFKIGMCGNWATLYHYGKGVSQMMTPLTENKENGKDFVTCVSAETPAPGPLDVYQNKDLDDLHTHNSALVDIIKSLEDDSIQITGIYGLGGVGKTTLAKEVVARVKNTLFSHVAFTTVSQNVDVKKIRKDILVATKRMMKGDKILIILDDVWEKVDLEELCIPCESNYKNCKILLTSRSEEACQKMKARSIICVNPLPAEEAWILFKRVVGERLEMDANLKSVAQEVAKECGGLPLLIEALGNSLKDESIDLWKAGLSRLKKSATSEMDPDVEKAFTRLQLS